MFRGSFEHTIDAKGRVSVPVRYREYVASTGNLEVVVTRTLLSPPKCLEAYAMPDWQRLEEDARRLKRFDRNAQHFENIYLGNAHVCEVDGQGRILVPPKLREFAELEKHVVFSGARDKFRIWKREVWEAVQEEAEQELAENRDFLSGFDL